MMSLLRDKRWIDGLPKPSPLDLSLKEANLIMASGLPSPPTTPSTPPAIQSPARLQAEAEEGMEQARARVEQALDDWDAAAERSAREALNGNGEGALSLEQLSISDAQGMANRARAQEASYCVVCLDATPSMVVVPCGHLCLCEKAECRSHLKSICPVCRGAVQTIMKVYK